MNQQSSLVPTEGFGRLSRPYLTEYLAHIFSDMPIYRKIFDPKYLELRELWVNYQKPGQYNPYHCHHGVVSFVIFVDIPYGVEERKDFASDGGFQLEDRLINVDKSWNEQC